MFRGDCMQFVGGGAVDEIAMEPELRPIYMGLQIQSNPLRMHNNIDLLKGSQRHILLGGLHTVQHFVSLLVLARDRDK